MFEVYEDEDRARASPIKHWKCIATGRKSDGQSGVGKDWFVLGLIAAFLFSSLQIILTHRRCPVRRIFLLALGSSDEA